MKGDIELPEFQQPARFAYRYRWRLLGWLLDGHAYVREAMTRAWPRAIRREFAVNERIIEVPFVLRNLDLTPGSRILDVGSQWSPLPLSLAALGYRTVATDLVPVRLRGSGPDVVQADLRRPPFRPGSFDGAVIVSTLEHIGLGYYDSRRNEDDDETLMQELRELVRPGGLLLLTVPFGRGGTGPTQRAYDGARLRKVTRGLAWEAASFCVQAGPSWMQTSEEEAAQRDSTQLTRAVALLKLRRS